MVFFAQFLNLFYFSISYNIKHILQSSCLILYWHLWHLQGALKSSDQVQKQKNNEQEERKDTLRKLQQNDDK